MTAKYERAPKRGHLLLYPFDLRLLSGKVCLAKVDAKTEEGWGGISEGNWPCAQVRSPSPAFHRGFFTREQEYNGVSAFTRDIRFETQRVYFSLEIIVTRRLSIEEDGARSKYNYRKPEYISRF